MATAQGMNPLFRMALLKGSLTSVLLHVRRGTPLDGRDDKGLTPLMLAAAAGRAEICRLLLEEGADAAADQSGRTAADLAVHAGHRHLAEVLTVPSPPVKPPAVAVVVSGTLPERRHDEGDIWEAEDVFEAAAADATVFSQLIETQAAISSARALNPDADWHDIAIELPDVTPLPGSDSSARALRMIGEALRDPLVGWPNLARVTRRLAGLGTLLEDLGITTSTTDFETALFCSSEPFRAHSDEAVTIEIAEAVEALRTWRPSTELYQLEVSRLPVPDRSAEQSMFNAFREAKRQVITTLLHALPLAGHSLGAAEAEDDDEAEVLSEDSAGELSAEEVEKESEQSLKAALKAVRDGARKADAEAMIDLDIDPHLVATFTTALARSTAGDVLRSQLTAATAKYLGIRDRVTEANLPLVLRYADRSMRPGVLLEDLIQDGSIGLMRAVERFDVSRGYRFMTYAVWWIRQACGRTAEDHARTIRIPVHLNDQVQRIARARTRLIESLGRQPRADELAAAIGVSPARAELLDRLRHRTVSIETIKVRTIVSQLVGDNEVTPFDTVVAKEHQRIIARTLETLTPRQEHVIRSRFGFSGLDEQTLEEIGTKMSVTRERIRQIESKALKTLKMRSTRTTPRLRALR